MGLVFEVFAIFKKCLLLFIIIYNILILFQLESFINDTDLERNDIIDINDYSTQNTFVVLNKAIGNYIKSLENLREKLKEIKTPIEKVKYESNVKTTVAAASGWVGTAAIGLALLATPAALPLAVPGIVGIISSGMTKLIDHDANILAKKKFCTEINLCIKDVETSGEELDAILINIKSLYYNMIELGYSEQDAKAGIVFMMAIGIGDNAVSMVSQIMNDSELKPIFLNAAESLTPGIQIIELISGCSAAVDEDNVEAIGNKFLNRYSKILIGMSFCGGLAINFIDLVNTIVSWNTDHPAIKEIEKFIKEINEAIAQLKEKCHLLDKCISNIKFKRHEYSTNQTLYKMRQDYSNRIRKHEQDNLEREKKLIRQFQEREAQFQSELNKMKAEIEEVNEQRRKEQSQQNEVNAKFEAFMNDFKKT